MTSTIRTAALALAAGFALLSPGRASVPVPNAVAAAEAAPAAFAQLEIRGLDAFFAAVDRIAAPYAPAGQAKAMLTGMGGASLGVNPFELIDGNGTMRLVVYGVDNDMDVLLDFPAAGGDVAGALGKLERALPAAAVPEGVVLPEGTLSLRGGNFSSSVFIPRGERIVLVPHSAFAHDIRDADGALAVLDAAPTVPAGGVLAVAVDFAGMRRCLATARHGSSGAQLRAFLSNPDFPVRVLALGLGLDGSDRLRGNLSASLVPGTPAARFAAAGGAPASPLANAILFPDAVAAASGREGYSAFSDGELRDFILREFNADCFGASLSQEEGGNPLPAEVRDACVSACIPLCRLLGDEYAAVLLPLEEGGTPGSAGLLAFPENPQEALDALPARVNEAVSGFAEAVRNAAGCEGNGKLPRIEPAGERLVQGIPVRSFRLVGGDAEDAGAREHAAFDAAAAGSALYVGTLPEGRLSEVLADLSAGETAKGPVASMPAFAAAYGEAPADAACSFIRLLSAFRALLPRIGEFVKVLEEDDPSLGAFFPEDLAERVAASSLPDLAVATTQRWIPGEGRSDSVVSMSLADLHAAIDAIVLFQRRLAADTHSPRRSPRGPARPCQRVQD